MAKEKIYPRIRIRKATQEDYVRANWVAEKLSFRGAYGFFVIASANYEACCVAVGRLLDKESDPTKGLDGQAEMVSSIRDIIKKKKKKRKRNTDVNGGPSDFPF